MLCDQASLSVIFSAFSLTQKLTVCMDLHEIITEGRSWPNLEVISFLR